MYSSLNKDKSALTFAHFMFNITGLVEYNWTQHFLAVTFTQWFICNVVKISSMVLSIFVLCLCGIVLFHNRDIFIFKFPYRQLPLILLQRTLCLLNFPTIRMTEKWPNDSQYKDREVFICNFKTFQLRYSVTVTVSKFSFFSSNTRICDVTDLLIWLSTHFHCIFWKVSGWNAFDFALCGL